MSPLPPVPEKVKRFFPVAVAVLMGLLAVGLTQRYLVQQRRAIEIEVERKHALEAQQNAVEVVVAAKDVPADVRLEPSFLTTALVPGQFVQPYAVQSSQEVLGKVTIAPIAAGEQILSTKVRRPEEAPVGSTLSTVTPKGKRAITISVDTLTGVGGFVRPGDLVDILWTLGGGQEGQVVTWTLFQDVPVLAVGREIGGAAGTKPGGGEEGASQYTVTLALEPQETSFLLFARDQGRIQLSLRPKSDKGSKVSVAPANISTLLEMQLGVKLPPPPPPKPLAKEVEVYKGLERNVVSLPDHGE